ncbi:MAG: Nucleotide-binding protein UspA family [Candidatus Methanohalarchaeum thermophilum]|uniref:Nucleotide-binding protein UspA family n=1 Tax=Methanohalarchaeum thermophilum TaxID=1903181 RepID=A0A1Q6DRV2_METT1|nr:MAG: Nucleotide-binding protein UspA family [Candidatus Methanohalarchaeum thermophilum]
MKDQEKSRKEKILVLLAYPEIQENLINFAKASANSYKESSIIGFNFINLPEQTPLTRRDKLNSPKVEIPDKKIVEIQKAILKIARDKITSDNFDFDSKAMAGRKFEKTVINYVKKQNIDQIYMGWDGERSQNKLIFGSKVDKILKYVPCKVNIIKPGKPKIGKVAAFIKKEKDSNTLETLKRANQFQTESQESKLNIIHINGKNNSKNKTRERLKEKIEEANISREDYKLRIYNRENIVESIINESKNFDTVCLGSTQLSRFKKPTFGSIPKKIALNSNENVVIIKKRKRLKTLKDKLSF